VRRGLLVTVMFGGAAGVWRLVARGKVTVDVGTGRSVLPLGPVTWKIAASPEVVFDVIADPYLRRTPRALQEKLIVWERGTDMVLAAHVTQTPIGATTTLETVRFERPTRVEFRLVRGPVPHVSESFELEPVGAGTELTWRGELGTDFWAAGRWWGAKVAVFWETAVRASLEAITAEAERRAS
jgi:Polyketide cyclase / dehydrase and lipid transport